MFVFLSYKSEDSNLVREVAEQLIGCGLKVWFNSRVPSAENATPPASRSSRSLDSLNSRPVTASSSVAVSPLEETGSRVPFGEEAI